MLALILVLSTLACLDALPDVKSLRQASLYSTQPTAPKFGRSFEVSYFPFAACIGSVEQV